MYKFLPLLLATALIAPLAKAETYGVVIGINDYPNPTDAAGSPLKDENGRPVESKLRGCVNDANNMRSLFTSKYGIKDGNLIVLTDKQANGKAFVDAMKTTLGKLQPGDQFVFTYSGHGTRVPDKESKDPDGKGSAIVLVDYQLVPGKLFGDIARMLSGRNVKSTFLFDSCFAGGMSRDTNPYGFVGARVKALKENQLPKKARLTNRFDSLANVKSKAALPQEGNGEYAFIYASQYDVTSIDFPGVPEKNVPPQGLFSYALLSVLQEAPESPIGDVVDAIASFFDDVFKGKDIKQRPQDEFSSAGRAKLPLVIKG